jgi:Domain of unknown function (DUF1931)
MGSAKFERLFRAAGGVSVDRDDVNRYLDFVNDAIYDLMVIGRATAKANVRDGIEPWDLPITKGLQESMHQFENWKRRPNSSPSSNPGRPATARRHAGRGYRSPAPADLRRHQRRTGQDVQAYRRRVEGRTHRRMGTDVQPLPAADLNRHRPGAGTEQLRGGKEQTCCKPALT